MMGSASLFHQGQLGLFTGFHLLFTPAALPGNTLQAQRAGHIDKEQLIAHVIPASLDHDGGIVEMTVDVRDKKQLEKLVAAMRRISGVRDVERLFN